MQRATCSLLVLALGCLLAVTHATARATEPASQPAEATEGYGHDNSYVHYHKNPRLKGRQFDTISKKDKVVADGCIPGYGWSDKRKKCLPCTSGSYSPGGYSHCLSCGGGINDEEEAPRFATPEGATEAAQCVCAAGYGGPACDLCPIGSYSPGGVFGSEAQARPACTVCPQNSAGSREPGAKSRLDCGGCNAGTGGLDCETCAAGTYSEGGSYAPCAYCGAYATSAPGSPSREYCSCLSGYGLDSTGGCAICPLGTFWPGPPPLSAAPAGAASPAAAKPLSVQACLACAALSPDGGEGYTTRTLGATAATQCVCKPGYAGPFCAKCDDDEVCPGGTTDALSVCPANSLPPAGGATTVAQCVCRPGAGRPAASKDCKDCPICDVCPANTWSAGLTRRACNACPAGTTSPPGAVRINDCRRIVCPDGMDLNTDPFADSPTVSQCVCKAGYGGGSSSDVAGCRLCSAGTWSGGGNLDSCTPCAFGQTSPAGATKATDCVRAAVSCPRGQVAPPGAVSVAQCACQAGYGAPSACTNCTACELCPVGTWSAGGRLEPCAPCRFGSTSLPGSDADVDCYPTDQCPPGTQVSPGATPPSGSSAAECKCKPGFGGVQVLPPGVVTPYCIQCEPGRFQAGSTLDPCLVCPANTYAAAFGSSKCEACPADSVSTPNYKGCVCNAGFGSDRAGGCAQCAPGSFSAGGLVAVPLAPQLQTCPRCPPNTWSNLPGATECKPCPAGATANELGTGCVCPNNGQWVPPACVSKDAKSSALTTVEAERSRITDLCASIDFGDIGPIDDALDTVDKLPLPGVSGAVGFVRSLLKADVCASDNKVLDFLFKLGTALTFGPACALKSGDLGDLQRLVKQIDTSLQCAADQFGRLGAAIDDSVSEGDVTGVANGVVDAACAAGLCGVESNASARRAEALAALQPSFPGAFPLTTIEACDYLQLVLNVVKCVYGDCQSLADTVPDLLEEGLDAAIKGVQGSFRKWAEDQLPTAKSLDDLKAAYAADINLKPCIEGDPASAELIKCKALACYEALVASAQGVQDVVAKVEALLEELDALAERVSGGSLAEDLAKSFVTVALAALAGNTKALEADPLANTLVLFTRELIKQPSLEGLAKGVQAATRLPALVKDIQELRDQIDQATQGTCKSVFTQAAQDPALDTIRNNFPALAAVLSGFSKVPKLEVNAGFVTYNVQGALPLSWPEADGRTELSRNSLVDALGGDVPGAVKDALKQLLPNFKFTLPSSIRCSEGNKTVPLPNEHFPWLQFRLA